MQDGVTIPLQIVDTNGSATLTRIMQQYERMYASQKRMLAEGERGARGMAASYNLAATAIEKSGHAATNVATKLASSMQGAIRTTATWTSAIAGLGGGAGLGLLLRQGIKLNDEMQRYRITLTTVMHSQARANGQIAWLLRYAEQTPFKIHGLVESSTQLEAFAVNSRKWLPLIGDLASAFGGTNEQVTELVEAVGKLKSGLSGIAFRTFRRFGISHEDFERQGATFDKGGELTSNVEDAMQILENIINERFGGMMGRMRGIYTQVMSNIADVSTNVLRETTHPLFEAFSSDLSDLLTKLEAMRNDGSLAVLTDRAGNGLVDLYASMKSGVDKNLLTPFMEGASISTILGDMFEKVKPEAEQFIVWFATKVGEGIVEAIKLAMANPTLAGAAAAYQFGPSAVNAGGTTLTALASYLGLRSVAASIGGSGAVGTAGAGGIGAALMQTLGLTGGFATAGYGLASLTDSIGGVFGGEGPSWWNPLGRFGASLNSSNSDINAYRAMMERNQAFLANRPQRIASETDNRSWISSISEKLFGNNEERFDSAFLSRVRLSGDESRGILDHVNQLSAVASGNTSDGLRRLSESAEGLASKLLDVDGRLEDSTRRMPLFNERIREMYSSMRATTDAMTRREMSPANALDNIMGAYRNIERGRLDAAMAEQERVILEAKARQSGIKGNQNFVGKYLEMMGADEKGAEKFLAGPEYSNNPSIAAKMVSDYLEAFKIRQIFDRTGTGGGASSELLGRLGYTGLIPEKLSNQTALDDLIKSANSTGNFNEAQIQAFRQAFSQRGGLELNTDAVRRQLDEVMQNFSLFSEDDRKQLDEITSAFPQAVIESFREGAEAAAVEIRSRLGVTLNDQMDALIVAAIDGAAEAIRRAGKRNAGTDWAADSFGSGN